MSILADGVDLSLPLDSGCDRGTFVGPADIAVGDDKGQIITISETESTFATDLLTHEAGATPQAFAGRTTTLDNLPTAQATLTGTYVGAFVNDDEDRLRQYITGDAAIDVDFDGMTIVGRIGNKTSDLFT